MHYRLLFGATPIGEIHKDDADFPTFFGRIEFLPSLRSLPELRDVLEYVNYSLRAWPLIEQDRFDDPVFDEEFQHRAVINSEKWCLLDGRGNRIPILVPIFCTGNRVNWRLDLARSSAPTDPA
jgi:hypothetical protein